jgi:membrane-associated protein
MTRPGLSVALVQTWWPASRSRPTQGAIDASGTMGAVDIAERLLDAVAGIGLPGLYFVTGFLAFGECALLLDVVVPGETGMVVAGAAGARADASLPLLITAAAVGATLGDSASYALGRFAGLPLVRRWGWLRRRVEGKVDTANEYFQRRGGAAVFLGRFVGFIRGVVPFVAGTAQMPYRRFLPWNVAASIVWTGAVVSAGYLLGQHIEAVVDNIAIVVSVVIVVGFVGWLIYRRTRRVSSPARDAPTR